MLRETLGFEGGYSNNPDDRGGETNFGITAGTYAKAKSLGLVVGKSVRDLTRYEAARIYHDLYWKACKADLMPEPLDLLVFDAAVNHGVGGSGRLLQKSLNWLGADLKVDGAVGPKTWGALADLLEREKDLGLKALCAAFMAFRAKYFADIVSKDATQKAFLWGWIRLRVAALMEKAGMV